MKIKNIIMEDFINYKKASMFIITCVCDWKCCLEQNLPIDICQNSEVVKLPNKEIEDEKILTSFLQNDISKAVVIGGLEPLLQFEEVYNLIKVFRQNNCMVDFVIYTGYNQEEIEDKIKKLQEFENIIIKFGRFFPNQNSHYDEVLGVNLASNNQYAKKIS